MRILVVSAFEASSQWASAINTVKMAQGFVRSGHDVTILCQESVNGKIPSKKLSQIYGLTEKLDWIQLPRTIFNKPVDPHWQFSILALPFLLWIRPNLVFARSYIFPYLSSRVGISTIVESHAYPDNDTAPFLRMVKGSQRPAFRLWVTISHYLARHYCSLGVPKEKLLVLPDAVDFSLFQRPEQLPANPYPEHQKNVAYVGHLYDYKGIPALLEAAGLLPDIYFHLIGGWEEDLHKQQQRAKELKLKNVTFYGLRPQIEIPKYLWRADVLLLPPSAKHPSGLWTSPIKLGEYLASKTPVVATSIPALKDWLTDEEVRFVEPDNAQALAEGIRYVLKHPDHAQALTRKGFTKARTLSYQRRAAHILKKYEQRVGNFLE